MGSDKAILLADVSGSTPLYEHYGDEQASRMVYECVEGMQAIAERRGGQFVRSKGDDVLCVFEDAHAALLTAQDILDHGASGSVSVHAGLHWGPVLWRGSELFGGAINVAARLSGKAKVNEVLISGEFTTQIELHQDVKLRPMGEITLRGTNAPTRVFALIAASRGKDGVTRVMAQPTQVMLETRAKAKGVVAQLICGDWRGMATEEQKITVGRSLQSDLVISEGWVSRAHATFSVVDGIVEIADSSAAGCTIRYPDGSSYFIHRQVIALHGEGVVQLGSTSVEGPLPEIRFRVAQRESA